MASTPVEFNAPSDLTLTINFYPFGSDTVASGGAATERSNCKGLYSRTVSESISGWHNAVILLDGVVIGGGVVFLTDTTNIHRVESAPHAAYDRLAALRAADVDGGDVATAQNVTDAETAILAAVAAVPPAPPASEVADAVWDEPNGDHATDGTTGKNLADTRTAATAIKAKTDNLPASPAAVGSAMTLAAGAVNASAIAADAIDADALADDALAAIQLQVNSALDAAIAELSSGAPSATPSLRTAVMLLYMAFRNNYQQTATERRVKNDAGTTIAKGTVSDSGGVLSTGELGAP